VPTEPTTLEVHFFPDRHIEVAITDKYSPPRLALTAASAPGYRVGRDVRGEELAASRKDDQAAECRDGEFPINGDYYDEQVKKLEAQSEQGKR
jgi:hypothetical protein